MKGKGGHKRTTQVMVQAAATKKMPEALASSADNFCASILDAGQLIG